MGYDGKAAINIPIASTLAARLVAYETKFGGFIDAVGPAAGKNVNDGNRFGTRVSFLWQPVPEVKVTPRLVFQRVEANGFNREEFYNLYDNQFTTTGGDLIGKRTQYLKMREKFRDQTTLLDLTASYDFGGAELTSVTSKLLRDILVSRDASALTGSVSISFAGLDPAIAPAANLVSNLRDTTKLNQFTQELRLASTGTGPLIHGSRSHQAWSSKRLVGFVKDAPVARAASASRRFNRSVASLSSWRSVPVNCVSGLQSFEPNSRG